MNDDISAVVKDAINILLSTSLAKIEVDVPKHPKVKVVAYWCGVTMRIDVKGVKA